MANARDAYHRLCGGRGQLIHRKSSRAGYSRVDLLIGLVLVLFGGSLLVMWLSRTTSQARRTRCEQKQIVLARAVAAHSLIHHEFPGWLQSGPEATELSWGATILPWIGRPLDEDELAGKQPVDQRIRGPRGEAFDRLQQNQSAGNALPAEFIGEFLCPDDPRMIPAGNERGAWMSYVVNAGKPDRPAPSGDEPPDEKGNGVFLDYTRSSERMTLEFVREHDGESYTLMLSENVDAGLWPDHEERQLSFLWNDGEPAMLRINELAGRSDGGVRFARPSSRHSKGVNVIFVGENTEFLNEAIDGRVLQQMMTSDSSPTADASESPPEP